MVSFPRVLPQVIGSLSSRSLWEVLSLTSKPCLLHHKAALVLS